MEAYAFWLHTIPGMGAGTIETLLAYAKTEENIYRLKETEIRSLLKPALADRFLMWQREKNPIREYEKLCRAGISFYPKNHREYPKRLREIPGSPKSLYVKGRLPEETKRTVAIIGARECSPYGRAMAEYYAKGRSEQGISVISGLARGIDGIAQWAALNTGGDTYGVMGCGVDICYPKEHWKLYERTIKGGGILSEYPPGTEPKAGLFPPRNRIISALSDLVLVVEAREKSGTLITVDMALEQGRDVYAVPGRVTDPLSRGCNKLIRQGAGIAACLEDVLNAFGMEQKNLSAEKKEPELKEELERKIYRILDAMPKHFTNIMEEIGNQEKADAVMAAVLELRLKGLIKEKGKNYYYRQAE